MIKTLQTLALQVLAPTASPRNAVAQVTCTHVRSRWAEATNLAQLTKIRKSYRVPWYVAKGSVCVTIVFAEPL